MAITKLNSLAIPPDTVVESDISFPLDSASFTGDLTVDTDTLVVDSTNNRVGIGEDAPYSVLHAAKSDSTAVGSTLTSRLNDSRLFIQNTDTTSGNSAGITLNTAAGSNNYWFIDAVGASSYGSPLLFSQRTGSSTVSERFRINGNGKFGFNETNPLATVCIKGAVSTLSSFEVNSNSGGATIEVINRSAAAAQTLGLYANQSGAITFNTGAPYAERARVDSDGIKFNGDTAAANALDDYEEGTWTPSISSSGTAPTITAYTRRTGRYTKIGDTVRFQLFIEFTCTAIGTGLAYVSLPFACISGDSYSAVSVAFNNVFTIGSNQHLGAYTESAQDQIYFTSNASLLNIGATGSGLRLIVAGVYEAS